jgi:hypothetical protein
MRRSTLLLAIFFGLRAALSAGDEAPVESPAKILSVFAGESEEDGHRILELAFRNDGVVLLGLAGKTEECAELLPHRSLESLRFALEPERRLDPWQLLEDYEFQNHQLSDEDCVTFVFESTVENPLPKVRRYPRRALPEKLLSLVALIDDLEKEACRSDDWSLVNVISR